MTDGSDDIEQQIARPQVDIVIDEQIATRRELHVVVGRAQSGHGQAVNRERTDRQIVAVGELHHTAVVDRQHVDIVRIGQRRRARDRERQSVRDDHIARILADVPGHVQQQIARSQIDVLIHDDIPARREPDIIARRRKAGHRLTMHRQRPDRHVVAVGELHRTTVVDRQQVDIVRAGQRRCARDDQRQAVRDDGVADVLADVPGHTQQQVAGPQIDILVHHEIAARGELHVITGGRDARYSHAVNRQ